MSQHTIKSALFGAAALSLGLGAGCLKDKYAYDTNNDAQEDMGGVTEEMGVKPAGECATAQDCPALSNAEARCDAQKTCAYTCAQGWGDPEGKIATQGCTCDKATSSCEPTSTCGDGFKEGTEQCDDGPQNSDSSPDACRTSCQPASCGDGVVDTGELCDDGNQDNTDACTTQCSPCGNGKLDEGERCDDGNSDDGDGCSSACAVEELWACDEATSPSQCWEEWTPPADRPFMKGFGLTADILGDVAVVGAPLDETYAVNGGTAHVYERRNGRWTYAQELKPDEDIQENSTFGIKAIITPEGDIIVAAPNNNSGTGAIYIYQKQDGTWQLKERLTASALGISGRLTTGYIAYHNNYLATSDPNANNNQGIVHILKRNNPNLKFAHDFSIDGWTGQKLGGPLAIINTAQRQLVVHGTVKYSDAIPKPMLLGTDLKTKTLLSLHSFQDNDSKYGDSGICALTENSLTFTRTYKYPHDATVNLYDLNVFDYFGSKERTQLITPFDLSGEDTLNNVISVAPTTKFYTMMAACKNGHMALYAPNGNNKQGLVQIYKQTGNTWSQVSANLPIPSNPNATELERLTHYATTDGTYTLIGMPKFGLNANVSESKVFPVKN